LMRLNDDGFEISTDLEKMIDDHGLKYAEDNHIPSWLLFAGQHGEFELIFTIPQNFKKKFLEDAEKNGFYPIEIGKVIPEKEIRMNLYDVLIPINSEFIRNLPFETKGDVNHYLKLLLDYDSQLNNDACLNFTTI
jgi:thiamine-monophosphate kinase